MSRFIHWCLFLLSVVIISGSQVSATTLQIEGIDQPIELSPYFHYGKVNFSVQSGKLNIGLVDTSGFKTLSKSPVPYNPGIQKQLFILNLKNITPEQHWFLSIDFYPLHHITLFLADSAGNILNTQEGGALYPIPAGFHDRSSHVFPFELSPNVPYRLYIAVETQSFMLFPATLHTASSLLEVKSYRLLYIWLTFGFVLAAFILNLTLYLSSRETPFLVLMALMVVLIIGSYYQYGFGFELYPNMPDFLKIRMRILFVAPIGILLNLFTIRFLNLKNHKVLFNLFRTFNFILGIYFLLILLHFLPFSILNFMSPLIMTLVMILNIMAGLRALKNQQRYAVWFFPGVISLLLSSLALSLVLLQIVPFNTLWYHANYFGTALFCLMLTLGMNMKIAAIRNSEAKLAVSQKLNADLQSALVSNEQMTRMLEMRTRELEKEQLSTHLLTSAVESSDSTIVITNPDGIIEYVNPAFTRITGYQPLEAIGKIPSILKSGTQDKLFYQSLWQTIKGGETWVGEFQNKRKDGTLYWESAVITPVFSKPSNEISHFIAVKNDITTEKENINRLAYSEKQLREANRIKDQFFTILSHDLMNPFNALLGFSQILAENLHEHNLEPEAEYATIIHDSASKIMAMLQNLLVWSGGNSGNLPFTPGRASVPGLIADSVAIVIPAAQRKKVKIIITEPVIPEATLDINLVSVILRNLLWNALHFSPEGGEITIQTKNDNNQLIFKVCSGGILLNPEHLAEIFELPALRKNKDNRHIGKTGFGLFISKELAEIHGGQIFAESIPNQGNIFGISIPQ